MTQATKKLLPLVAMCAIAAGCVESGTINDMAVPMNASQKMVTERANYRAFVETIRRYALEPEEPNGLPHGISATTEDWESHYKLVYVDEHYVSYWCDDYSYTGGAHGNTVIHVGTIDRKTGKVLALADIFPKDRQDALKEELRQKAADALGSKAAVQYEDRLLTDNFCLMDDGWHFVYSPYNIACFAAGTVELVIARTSSQVAGRSLGQSGHATKTGQGEAVMAPFSHERRAALWTEAWGGMRVDWTAVADWPTGDSPAAKAARTWIEERLRFDRKSFDGDLRDWDAMTRFHGKRFLAKNGQKQIEEEWRGPNVEETKPRIGMPAADPGADVFLEDRPLWFSRHSATIEYEDERIVSYRSGFYGSHVGNATSAAYVRCATFRKSDGKILGWDSFADTNAVFQLIREQAKEKFGKNADLYGNGIPVPDEPLFTKDGFWVFWGDYSIDTPHAYEEGGKFPSLFIRWKTADGSAEILRIDVDEAFRRKL